MAPDELLDLSQNLNPFAPPAADVVRRHLGATAHYPDPLTATQMLAEHLGVAPERVVLTNGGSEAIHVVAAEVGGAVLSEPEFALHPRGAQGRSGGPRWRSNPHSPTGRLAGPDVEAEVWDEAFHALATGRWSAGREGLVVGSLTKTFACPGLRLGYVIARDEEQARRLAGRLPHWSVSALALACLPDLLAGGDLPGWSASIAAARLDLVRLLETQGLRVRSAEAPWVLVEEDGLRERLAPGGVLVRDCTSFGLAGTARIAVPDAAGLTRLASALETTV